MIFACIALAVASPVDKQTPPAAPVQNPIDNQKSLDPIPLNKAPLSPSTVDLHPLNKRDTPKTQAPSAVNSQKNQSPAAAASPTAQKDATKPIDANRKTRDTAQKTAPAANPSNVQPQKSKTQQAPATPVQSSKKTREVPKKDEVKKTPIENAQKSSNPAVAPQVARVPLTSTNTRSRRDAPKSVEQQPAVTNVKSDNTKITSTVTKLADVPATANVKPKRDTPAEDAHSEVASNVSNNNNNNQSHTGLRRPAPVDQILKHRAAATSTEA